MKWKKDLKKWLRIGKDKHSGWVRADLIEMAPRWKNALVLICSDCGQRVENHESAIKSEAWAEGLRRWLKMKLVQEFTWGKKIRVVTTRCLDICPKGKIVVLIAANHPASHQQLLLMHPVLHRKKLLEKIRSLLD